MSAPPPGSSVSRPVRWLLAPIRVLVAVVVILDELAWPLYRPVARWFASLGLVRRLEAAIAALPPYAVLFILAIPLVGVEPLKILALVWMGRGQFIAGLLLLALAYAGSFLVVDRIYHAGKPQLMRIGWFAVTMGFVVRIRTTVLAWARGTRTWAAAMALVRQGRVLRAQIVRFLRRARHAGP